MHQALEHVDIVYDGDLKMRNGSLRSCKCNICITGAKLQQLPSPRKMTRWRVALQLSLGHTVSFTRQAKHLLAAKNHD